MTKRNFPEVTATLETIVGGGQTLATLDDGRKLFVWGGLPGETVRVQVTKKKSHYSEGVVADVLTKSPDRVVPKDGDSYLSTSPWQIMSFDSEQAAKQALILEAFSLHKIALDDAPTTLAVAPIGLATLPLPSAPSETSPETSAGGGEIYSDGREYGYRNKVEYSFWYDTDTEALSLAFFRRGTHGKIPVLGTHLAQPAINDAASAIVGVLNDMKIEGRALKTLLLRCNAAGEVSWQLYVKDEDFPAGDFMASVPGARSGEIIFSNPKSPASVITKRLAGTVTPLTDTILSVPFSYATESFFQVNIPVYEQALRDMAGFVLPNTPVVDLYSGVGTIGLTIGGDDVTLVEINESAVREMKRNITALHRENTAHAVLAASETALDYISGDKTIIVDPPRAGLHADVVAKLLEAKPQRIIYLSCNPVTQARDVALLSDAYKIVHHRGYNFFPRTPHIEHLVVLDLC